MSYDDMPGVRWSHLKHMRVSPLHYRHATQHERKDTPSMMLGRAIHCAILEPEQYPSRYVVWYGGQRRGKAWEAFKAEHADILTTSEAYVVRACSDAVRGHEMARRSLEGGQREVGLTWTDPETGISCKGRLDHVRACVTDLKAPADIDPARFAAQCVRLGTFGQAAYYHDGAVLSGLDVRMPPRLVVVCTTPPHDVIVYELPEAALDHGRREYRRCLDRLAECLERDEWPGMAPDVRPLLPPAWAEEDEDSPAITIGGVALTG